MYRIVKPWSAKVRSAENRRVDVVAGEAARGLVQDQKPGRFVGQGARNFDQLLAPPEAARRPWRPEQWPGRR